MLENIFKKIESLPSLPQTIEKIEDFRKRNDTEIQNLVDILEQDALVVTTLLKIANSSLFGFKNRIETISRIINLLGINFVIYITISEAINNILKTDLEPYDIKSEDFMTASTGALSLANLWLSKIDRELKEEMLLPSLLQETGKFILSEWILSRGFLEEFRKKIDSGINITIAEKELLGVTTSQVTAKIFKYWNLSEDLIKTIEYVDDVDKSDEEYKYKAQILHVIKTVCNINSFLSDESIKKALTQAKEYGMDIKLLREAIETLKRRLNDS